MDMYTYYFNNIEPWIYYLCNIEPWIYHFYNIGRALDTYTYYFYNIEPWIFFQMTQRLEMYRDSLIDFLDNGPEKHQVIITA
jgi:hypothetical protein